MRAATALRLVAALAVLTLSACGKPPVNREAKTPLTTESSVDLERYLGRWYEIARLPNSFEKNCEGVTADYWRLEEGEIGVLNSCRKNGPSGRLVMAKGRARVVYAATNSKLEVSFFAPFWGDYWILGLADDYSLSLVGEPSGRYLWILSRSPTIDDATKTEALARLTALGYDVSKLYFPEQPPSPDNPPPSQAQ